MPKDGSQNEPSEFMRFEALTKKLVAVPKAEVDKARKKRVVKRRKPA